MILEDRQAVLKEQQVLLGKISVAATSFQVRDPGPLFGNDAPTFADMALCGLEFVF